MTELEKVQRAKMYMEKLANGINPIDDTMAPEEDIINHVRLSRCFFFVADMLQQVIENGGIKPATAPKKSQKRPFELPLEERNRFPYNAAAQRFIVENLDSIIAAAKTRSELKGALWEKVHDDCLIDLYQKSVPISEIAVTLKRSTSAIRKRLKKLGLDLR